MNAKTVLALAALLIAGAFSTAAVAAGDANASASTPASAPASKPVSKGTSLAIPLITKLPQVHEYQRGLRQYLATLTEKDFDHGVTGPLTTPPCDANIENQYRDFIHTTLPQPLVGSKRGVPSINAPARLFTMPAIETERGVMRVPVYPEALVTFLQWEYPGNVYHNNKALKLRAFVAASVSMMMLDTTMDTLPSLQRADWMGYQLISISASYLGLKDVLPPEVQKAYQDGVKRFARRMLAFGPRLEEAHADVQVAVALWYASRVCGDAELSRDAEAYARKVLTDPAFFSPAGYYIERGGLEVGYGGMSNYFAAWLALASDWPFAREAVTKAYRLRSHLVLPEPDGKLVGPSQFNTRIGSDAMGDQWDYACRDLGAAMVTDEAASFAKDANADELSGASARRAVEYNRQIAENTLAGGGRPGFKKNEEIGNSVWAFSMWPSYNFPTSVNFGYEFYRQGAYAHRESLQKQDSPLLKPVFARPGTFITNFGDAFVVAKQATFGAIVHAGPVGSQDPADGLVQFNSPLGFGGGQLSAFWTPKAGSVILGRRAGQHWERPFDKIEEWRLWPIHAVSGCMPGKMEGNEVVAGKAFSSACIARPQVTVETQADRATVTVSGAIPATIIGQEGAALAGKIEYSRTFKIGLKDVSVTTTLVGDGKDQVAELCETLPAFIDDPRLSTGRPGPKLAIELQVAGSWSPATDTWADNVQAVRISRYDGGILITFDRPQRVKLSPKQWVDTFITRATCRNILIDLLDSPTAPAAIKSKSVAYRIASLDNE